MSLISIVYAILCLCSLALATTYKLISKEKCNKHGNLAFSAITVAIFGYFLLSISKTLPLALFANRLSYAGTILLIIELLILVNDFCNFSISRKSLLFIFVVSFMVFVLVFTGGTAIKLYYSAVKLETEGNLTILIKRYGPLHNIYLIYVIVMYLLMIFSIIWSSIKNRSRLKVNPLVLLWMVFGNIMIWLVEKYLHTTMEHLAVSYVFTEMLLLLFFRSMEEYDQLSENFKSTKAKSIQDIIDCWAKEYDLSNREKEILQFLINNKTRDEIARNLFISENTVKKHVTHIYQKLQVTNRNDLLHKLNNEISK